MTNQPITIDGYFYFIPGMCRVYSEADLARLVATRTVAAHNVCKITGAMDLLLTFKPRLFSARETYVLRARSSIIFPDIIGSATVYAVSVSKIAKMVTKISLAPSSIWSK